ncbi:MAG TPA: DUF1501 domain-containing protein [Planctomycetaceae bacterium]|nr:DUF1501 domain-containing protein [Planctomycetaceae bacterium]
MRNQPTRRQFLQTLGAAGAVSFTGLLPRWTQCLASDAASKTDRILVLIQLAGGNDSLNTFVPYKNDDYHKARPGIGIGQGAALALDDELGLHPSLSGFRKLWDAGRLAVVDGVGYPEPDRSHFRSMDIWHSAQPQIADPRTGWLGRTFDDGVASGKTVEAAGIGMSKAPLAMIGRQTAPPTIQRLEEFRLLEPTAKVAPSVAGTAGAGSDLEFLRRTATTTLTSAERLKTLDHGDNSSGGYPHTGLGRHLKLVGQMITAEMPTRVFFVSLDGFDTHSQQAPGHAALLTELSEAVSAFVGDLKEHNLSDRVLIAGFSEFGRRVKENGSLGTDHGAAASLFAIAPEGKGGRYGSMPSLTDLDDGDLKFTTDFRRVYATLLESWLGIASEGVLGGKYEPLAFA